jgi:hypothetical protein
MKLKRFRLMAPTTASLFLVLGSQGFGQVVDEASMAEEGLGQAIPLTDVPHPALEAAQRVLGTPPTVAKIVVGTDPQVYELETTNQPGKAVGLNVLADGEVLNVKKEGARGSSR